MSMSLFKSYEVQQALVIARRYDCLGYPHFVRNTSICVDFDTL